MALQMLTNVSIAFVYRDAAFKSETISQTHLGETLEVLEEQEEWLYIKQEDGYIGWVARFFLCEKPADWDHHAFYYHGQLTSRIFQNPDRQSNAIRDITILSKLPLMAQKDGWAEVLLPDGMTGWLESYPRTIPSQVDVEQLIQTAFSFQGIQYFWAGRSPKGFDCSGFVQTVYGLHGIILPRDAYQQAEIGSRLEDDFSVWGAGDLLYFSEQSGSISHVAISLGKGDFIHASGFVKVNSLNPEHPELYLEKYHKLYTKAMRVL